MTSGCGHSQCVCVTALCARDFGLPASQEQSIERGYTRVHTYKHTHMDRRRIITEMSKSKIKQ